MADEKLHFLAVYWAISAHNQNIWTLPEIRKLL